MKILVVAHDPIGMAFHADALGIPAQIVTPDEVEKERGLNIEKAVPIVNYQDPKLLSGTFIPNPRKRYNRNKFKR